MKKTILSLAVIAASLLASCSKDSTLATGALPSIDPTGGNVVSITLSEEGVTRAVSSSAKDWEKSLSSLSLFAFDSDDHLLVKRVLSLSEIWAKSVSFALPKSTAGTECSFYAVANIDTSAITSKSDLMALIESSAASYNGTYEEVTNRAMRYGGFVMSGTKAQTIGAVNTTTAITITIKRTVAKVELELVTSDTFAASYPNATLTYKSATISKAASEASVIAGNIATGDMNYTHTQSNATPNYLFYIFENGNLAAGSRVLLEVIAAFDADGDATTTNDMSDITYSIELSGDGAGAISRNGFYTIDATINGLVGQDCDVTISVADWETPTAQDVNLGM